MSLNCRMAQFQLLMFSLVICSQVLMVAWPFSLCDTHPFPQVWYRNMALVIVHITVMWLGSLCGSFSYPVGTAKKKGLISWETDPDNWSCPHDCFFFLQTIPNSLEQHGREAVCTLLDMCMKEARIEICLL